MIEILSFTMTCISCAIEILEKPVTSIVNKYKAQKNNIYVYITGSQNPHPCSINYKKSSPMDFVTWKEKLEAGGNIIFEFEDYIKIKQNCRKKQQSPQQKAASEKVAQYYADHNKIMGLMIKNGLSDKIIASKIQDFSLFVEGTVNICYKKHIPNIGYSKKCLKTLVVYDNKQSFKFDISTDEYDNILKKSKGGIELEREVTFDEFMDYVSDKSILDREIIPSSLVKNVIKEAEDNIKMPICEFAWISVA